MKPNADFGKHNLCNKSENVIGSCDCLYKNDKASINESTGGTIREDLELNNGFRLFPDNLDVILADESLGKVSKVLDLLKNSIQDLYGRVGTLEMLSIKRSSHAKRMDWTEIISLAELRITEHDGKIAQRDLQRSLEIRSRTNMTFLVSQLRSTGRYRVTRRGRCNFIEMIE